MPPPRPDPRHAQPHQLEALAEQLRAETGRNVEVLTADLTLVDAALVGFDRGETVTIPPLEDLSGWEAMQAARLSLDGQLSKRAAASRYRAAAWGAVRSKVRDLTPMGLRRG